jgi:CdiI immunity protein
MNERDERLRQFFGGYFNQDWDVEGAQSWQDVVRQFVKENPSSAVLAVRDALRSWLLETATAAAPSQGLPAAFACDYDPRPDGFSDREWVEQVAVFIEEQVGHR